jgi:cell division GTPase FtsZ
MSTDTKTETVAQTIINDLDLGQTSTNDKPDQNKLAALKNKLKADKTEKQMAAKIIAPKERALNFFVVGSGQAGGRVAESMFHLGYQAVAINTAQQDLAHVNLPDQNKVLLQLGLGGAARERDIGRAAVEQHADRLSDLFSKLGSGTNVNILAASLGGGSGSGSFLPLIDLLSTTNNPIVVMCILPMANEDVSVKKNALEAIAELTEQVRSKRIQNLIVVDNAKIETIYSSVGQMEFYKVANEAIVEPLDKMNTLSMQPSPVKGLDPMEWVKLLIDGEGLSIYGQIKVQNYEGETAIAEAVMTSLDDNLLSGDFDIKQSKHVGVMYCAPKKVWDKIPVLHTNYANEMIGEMAGNPGGIFKGIYVTDTDEDALTIYTFFSGLSIPKDRLDLLRNEVQAKTALLKVKEEQRAVNLSVDTGKHALTTSTDKIKEKIASKGSPFNKFFQQSTTDRRK